MNHITAVHRKTIWLLGLGLIVCILASFTLGHYPVPLNELLGILGSRLGLPIEPFWTEQMETAVWNIRLPRVLLSVMVGACLSGAGASYQGIFQNPMASPDILGASAGAGFGAALAILVGLSSFGITLGAFLFSLGTVALVFWVSRHAKGDRILGLVLAGIMISSLFQSGTSFIKLVADPTNKLPQITYWLMGSLSAIRLEEIGAALLPMTVGAVVLFVLRWRLNLLTLSEEEAQSLGVNTRLLRAIVVLCSTLMTAACVSVSGMIGWIGLVIPHFVRMIAGYDYRVTLPASLLLGASFMILVDDLSRTLTTSEIPLGILTSFVGAPFFLYLILKEGKRQ